MKAALLPDRGVVKVSGETARKFLDGLVTSDLDRVTPQHARFAALLTPQGKIIVDFILAEASTEDGGGFFLDCPRALAPTLVQRLNFYRLRARVLAEDLGEALGVMAVWGGKGDTEYGLVYDDPRLPALGRRIMLPPHLAAEAARDLGATLTDAAAYEAHRIALGVPRGGLDFAYNDAFPHEACMDQLGGVDFDKGCYIGQEVVSRMQHRGTVRTRVMQVGYPEFAPQDGVPVTAGDRPVGTMGSAAEGYGLALLRLDRASDALAAGVPLLAGGIPVTPVKPAWAKFDFPLTTSAAT
ncbi:MAG: folate-binding protein YgfZ [Rhizobiales bacterium]|nr:folate-binding protein YgfZ [Hyphomicrobiales bacterium]